jgi:hypothetical protein
MKPITFSCEQTLALAPEDSARQILDVTKWPDFHGYGPIPDIKTAEFEVRTPEIVGSRIRVTNTDGSKHVEEFVEWEPTHRLRLEMKDFSAPLSRLATRIEETWEFDRVGNDHLHRGQTPRGRLGPSEKRAPVSSVRRAPPTQGVVCSLFPSCAHL